jgi:hypothetical protein
MKRSATKLTIPLFFVFLLPGFLSVCFAQQIRSYKADEVKPYKAGEITLNANRGKEEEKAANTDLDYFFGLYQYWVPGTSYTVPDYTNRQVVVHNSAGTGVLPGGIKINKDGSYVWNSSWEGKAIKGKWRSTGDRDYPIELLKAQEGKNWKVGRSNDTGVAIIIWDGFTWYNGKKIN